MDTKIKSEARESVALTADDYRRRIIRMVADMGNKKWLKFIYDFTYAFYLDDDCDAKGGVQV